jgi:chromosome segregation ATPase
MPSAAEDRRHRHVLASMAAARERMARAHSQYEGQLTVAEHVLAKDEVAAPVKSREAIQSELAHMLSVAKQLRENGQALEQAAAEEQARAQAAAEAQAHAQAAAQQTAAPAAAPAPPTEAPAGYDDIQSELEALQVEADEFNGELEGLRQSLDEVESSSGQESPRANAGGRGDHIGMLSGLRLTRSRRNLTEGCATARPALATGGHPTRAVRLLSESAS